ncbi:lectin [Burkholderia plantarii]|uniref:lectin n=1 Tax=Burkholderia plantarii TaxID=41899 RepID=UPI00272AD8D7|nr:lectin [Burkholderia plantarii]WLE61748.1 lectin [Burkholderia plantarii]
MTISRRSILKSGAAALAVGALDARGLTRALAATRRAAVSGAGDVVGKVTVGYQGWFAAIGDGAPINGWWHWAGNWAAAPSPANNAIKAWPDMQGYTHTYPTAFSPLNSGAPATLFSQYDLDTVNLQFSWMQRNEIDTAALQRFNPFSGEGATRDAAAAHVRQAAETYGRKFYIMYDVTGWTSMQTQIKQDWTSKMSAYTASSAYARQNGKPVVCIWGFGFDDANHPFDAAACADVIQWFKSQGCYVIGGVPTRWRTGESVRPNFLDVFHQFDMISPWMIGAIGSIADANAFAVEVAAADQADCAAHGIDYQPCVMPGDLSVRQRAHGNYMWRQFYNLVNLGVSGLYISMFDEYNEGNQIVNTAATQQDVPAGSGFLSLDEDGTPCSPDYYLRLTRDGGRMLKGTLALTQVRPTAPVLDSTTGLATVVSLRSRTNGLYVTAENAGSQPLIANRTASGPWEQFDLIDAGGGAVALRSHANGLYVTAENAGAAALIANRTAVGPWETFDLIVQPFTGAAVALRAHANGLYVTAANAGQGQLIAGAAQVGGWEQFDLLVS